MPSGVWDPTEYEKLRAYDGEIGDQATAGAFAAFHCHSSPESLCAGWAGHRDPLDLLAVRIGLADGRLNPAVAHYTPDRVPLWGSGAEAAAHGLSGVDAPNTAALRAIEKLVGLDPRRLQQTED